MQRRTWKRLGSLLLALSLATTGCSGDDGDPGPAGPAGAPGANGESCSVVSNVDGTFTITCAGGTVVVTNGTDGQDGGNVEVANFHGEAFLLSEGEFALDVNPKYFVKATITGATADADGVVTVDFTVTDEADAPVVGLTRVSALVAKLVPASGDDAWSRWVDYLQSVQTVAGSATGDWPNPDGTKSRQGTRENDGTLTEVADGQYRYRFAKDLSDVVVDGVAIPYERNLTHRVQIMMGGHSGPTAEATFDFVPDGSAVVASRDIVPTTSCTKCHGLEFHGHGGDRLTMEGCVTCHSSAGSAGEGVDPHGGESIDMTVMIHKIHAGGALPSAPGPDGLIWDDPATAENEADDNGEYAIWGHGNSKASWGKAEFPAVIENCTVCHAGAGAEVDNWKAVPSRKACGSCHDDVDFATGANHPAPGGAQADDGACAFCHADAAVAEAHDWTKKDIRNIPEFDVEVTLDTPERGYYVEGEAPKITIVLEKGGTPIDHTTVVEDAAAEGCTPVVGSEGTACAETADGLFRNANLYVTGPRAKRVPVLSTSARADVVSATAGPWDLSAGGASLRVVVDSGQFIVGYDPAGEDRRIPGDFTVTLPGAGPDLDALFASPAAATVDELVAWLMSDAAEFEFNERVFPFRDRAIAYRDEATGNLAIRSRPTIANTNIQVPESADATSLNQLLFTNHAVQTTGGASQVRARATASNNDPKAQRNVENIVYTLDPIDRYLKAGTYVVNVEFADLGRINTSNYRTPSVAVVTFQVKQAEEEKPIASNCKSCHWSDVTGTGYILDYPRHNKLFDDRAMDQCGGCHDYASTEVPGAPGWTAGLGGAKAIAKRVHAIHNGAALNYPVITVDHEESVPGRNWEIVYPMDVRNCESCHPAGETSGTWRTNPNRIACMGCHDDDAATAHMKAMTFDPTPSTAWNGDEEETCGACHR